MIKPVNCLISLQRWQIMNNELYDYYGRSIRTYEDWECVEAMKTEIARKIEMMSSNIFTIDDENLLEEYAPKLFNTLPRDRLDPFGNKIDVYYAVRNLLYEMINYRVNKLNKKRVSVAEHREGLAKHSQEDKAEFLRKRASELLKMIGGTKDRIGGEDMGFEKYHLAKALEDLVSHPINYVPAHFKGRKTSKREIKAALVELELPGKTPIIEEFIKKLR